MQNGHYHINPIELNGSYTLPDLMSIIRENAKEYFKRGSLFPDLASVINYVQSAIGCEDSECFGVLFLDNKHRLIEFKILFRGTIDSATVYPREVVKQAIKYNAGAVILCHNHPSGSTTPSLADIEITEKLEQVLGHIDIRVLDHIIVGNGASSSLSTLKEFNNESTPKTESVMLIDTYRVWKRIIRPQKNIEVPCSAEFFTEKEASKFIEDDYDHTDGELFIKVSKRN